MFLAVGGHARSGTTLLQALCDSHPELAVTNEFGNLKYLGESYPTYVRGMYDRWHRVQDRWAFNIAYANNYRVLRSAKNFMFTAHHLLTIRKYCRQTVTTDAIEAALKKSFPQARVVGDKWPYYLFLTHRFVNEPGLLRVVIYRDCRDVTSSFLKEARTTWWRNTPWIGNVDTAEKIARRWVEGIETMERYADKLYIIRYENLLHQPAEELEAFADWLGIDKDGFNRAMIKTTSIGKYKKGLTSEELDTIMEIAGPTLERLGYPV